MGAWALSDFRDELAAVFSSRGITNPQYTRWINLAKREVESAIQFEALQSAQYFSTVADQRAYAMPTDFLSIISILDRTSNQALIRTDIENIELRRYRSTGAPKFWARRGNELLLSPTPDSVYEIEALLNVESAELSADADVTSIPNYWDNAIFLLAAHYGWLILGEIEMAEKWMERYLNYMRSRLQDSDWEGTSRSEPVRIATSLSDLRRR